MRGFDVLVYALFLAALLFAVFRPGGGERQETARPGQALAPAGAADAEVIIELGEAAHSSVGTGFIVGDGVWLTARHVVDGCDDVGLLLFGNQGVRADAVALDADADLAVLAINLKRQPLKLDLDAAARRVGEAGFLVGFPAGRPGEVAARLLGRETLLVRGRYTQRSSALAWAPIPVPGAPAALAGISGGPVLSAQGAAIGVVVAEAPRRGRIYTAAPDTVETALTRAKARLPSRLAGEGALDARVIADVADRLRADLRVAKVVCVAR